MHDPPPSWYAETPLPRQAARYLWWGLAVKTRATYHSTRKSYVSSCRIAGAGPFPASLFNLARWIAELGIRYLKAKTIKSYLAAVRLFLVDIGATQDELKMFSHPTLFRTIAGIWRMNGEANTRERRHITRQVFLRILPLFDTTSLWGAIMHASFCLAFVAFLRVGEFTWSRAERNTSFQQWHITRGSVLLHPITCSFHYLPQRRIRFARVLPLPWPHHSTRPVRLCQSETSSPDFPVLKAAHYSILAR